MTRSASSKDKDDEEGDAPKVEEVGEEDEKKKEKKTVEEVTHARVGAGQQAEAHLALASLTTVKEPSAEDS